MSISVICVYNNKKQYEEQLVASLANQDCEYELIGIDNTDNKFSSAAGALNYGVNQSKGDVLIFSHQDIYIKGFSELNRFSEMVAGLPVGNIVGTQGAKYPSKNHISNITSGEKYISDNVCDFTEELYEVDCVDEGFFGIKRETWNKHRFDEKLCDDWHLYSVELCLNAKNNGYKVYVCPINLHHFSKGKITISYMKGMKRLCAKYRRMNYIWTTCYKVYTNRVYINILVLIWSVNRIVRGRSLR